MTTLHIHLGNKKTQKDCLGIIGDMPGAMFTSGKYLSQLPNSTVMMQKILDTKIFGLFVDRGMDQKGAVHVYNGILLSHIKGKKLCHLQRRGGA